MILTTAEHNRYLVASDLPQKHPDDPASINIELRAREGHWLSHIVLDNTVIPEIIKSVNTSDLARAKLEAMTDIANEIFSWLNHPSLKHKMCDGGRGNLGEQARFFDMQRRLQTLTRSAQHFLGKEVV